MEIKTTNKALKRNVAYKLRIGNINSGKQVTEDERLRYLEINNKRIVRVNVIANIVDKYIQEGEKNYGALTLDDGTGQIRAKLFKEETSKLDNLDQGDTILVIGLVKLWNNEIYITPEIIKKKVPVYLLIRKLESELEQPKLIDKEKIAELKDKIIGRVKEAEKEGGIDIEKLIFELKEHPSAIDQEIKKLLEEGIAYEPRPGKLRYLG